MVRPMGARSLPSLIPSTHFPVTLSLVVVYLMSSLLMRRCMFLMRLLHFAQLPLPCTSILGAVQPGVAQWLAPWSTPAMWWVGGGWAYWSCCD